MGMMLDPQTGGLFILAEIAMNLPRPLPDVIIRAPMGGKIVAGPPGGLQRRRCIRKIIIIIIITKILLLLLYDGKRAVVLIICIALYFTTFHTKAARRRPWPPLGAMYGVQKYLCYILFYNTISRTHTHPPDRFSFLLGYHVVLLQRLNSDFSGVRLRELLYCYLHYLAIKYRSCSEDVLIDKMLVNTTAFSSVSFYIHLV